MYSTQRYLNNNLVTASMISVSSQGIGTIAQAKKSNEGETTGTATCIPSGQYSGSTNLLYTVQCDVAGTVDDTAKFRWKTSATTASWEATGVSATSTATTLSNGIKILFGPGTLILNDTFQFWAYAENGPWTLLVNDRDRFWKSGAIVDVIINGGFTSATTDWTPTDCSLASIAGGQAGNCCELTVTGGSTQYFTQTLTTVSGEKYRIKIYAKSGTSGNEAFSVTAAGTAIIESTTTAAWVQHTATFVAAGTTTTLSIIKGTATAGTMLFDTVECRMLPSIEINLGSALLATAVVLADHNFSATATVTCAANSSDSWASPTYSLDILAASNQDPSIDYISQTFAYWKFFVDDAWNTDGYITIGKLYLGTYTGLVGTLDNIPWGSILAHQLIRIRNTSDAGKIDGRVYSKGAVFQTQYFPTRESGDSAIIEAIWESTFDLETGQDISIFVHYSIDDQDTLFLCKCLTDKLEQEFLDYSHSRMTLAWQEEIITRTI